jgi:hypothetical protein
MNTVFEVKRERCRQPLDHFGSWAPAFAGVTPFKLAAKPDFPIESASYAASPRCRVQLCGDTP